MKRSIIQAQIISVALAVFAMLFGSGNIVFPLGLGRDTGSMALYAMAGFFLTAVLVPLLGIVTMVLFDGKYKVFFERIGPRTGALVMFACMILIGPFCIIPRSISLALASLRYVFPVLNPWIFNPLSVGIIYIFTTRRSQVLAVLGKVLGPIKLFLLSAVIFKGLFAANQAFECNQPAMQTLVQGLMSGYGTLDLIGVIFFTSMILVGLRAHQAAYHLSDNQVLAVTIKGGALGALLLGVVYAGFILVSSFYSAVSICADADKQQLLSILAEQLLGASGGMLASITIAVACLTTALSLTTVFADYLQKDVFKHKVTYHMALLITLGLALFFSFYGFEQIMTMIEPVIKVLYPALIVLTVANLIYATTRVDFARAAFYVTLVGAVVLNYGAIVLKSAGILVG